MYASTNFKTKKQLKDAVKRGERVTLFSPGPFRAPQLDGTEYVEGPHYPEPHRWYAAVVVRNGIVVEVK